MKLLHFSDSFSESTETFIRYFVQKSVEFADVSLASFDEELLLSPLSWQKLTKETPFEIYPMLRVREKIFGSKWEKELDDYLEEVQPDIVHCHFGPTGLRYFKFQKRRKKKIPFVVSFYGYDAFFYPKKYKKYREELVALFNEPNSYTFVEGPHFKRQMLSLGALDADVFVNPLVVEDNRFETKREFDQDSKVVRFLMVGRFVEKKGFHLALTALGQLKDLLPPFQVSVIGFGFMDKVYRNILEEYNIENEVFFLGKKTHREVRDALLTHDYFMHPSMTSVDGDSEGGAPTIIIEAQSMGIPVIGSVHADIPFVMGYDDFLCAENNIESLKEKILRAIKSPDLKRLSDLGRQHVNKQHSRESSKLYEMNLRNVVKSYHK